MIEQTCRVLETWEPSPLTRAIRIERPEGFTFTTSQAVRLVVGGQPHPMSIASGPARPYLDFAVQTSGSDFKRAFFALQPGDEVVVIEVPAPRGRFPLERSRPAVMIASGIGITPFRSMLQALLDDGETLQGAFVHATASADEVPFREQIDQDAPAAGLRLLRVVGPVRPELLRALSDTIDAPIWYVSGPIEDVKQISADLAALGVGPESIRQEIFRYPGSLAAPAP